MTSELINELYKLRDENPKEALKLLGKLGDSPAERVVVAIVQIDCGDSLGDVNPVSQGIEVLREFQANQELYPETAYNLANGFQIRARLTFNPDSPVRGQASDDRFQARVQFGNVMRDPVASAELKSQASTNLGILLLETHRWVEALDYFQHALTLLPQNGVAAFHEMRHLMALGGLFFREASTYQTYCHLDALQERVHRLAQIVSDNYKTVEKFAGKSALPIVKKTVEDAKGISKISKNRVENRYFCFVQDNNLALSLHCSADEYASGRFDLLSIPSIQTNVSDGHGVPEIFAMFNVMKADFAFARQVFFDIRAPNADTPFFETTSHGDTLDYSLYGVRYSALTTAQRTAFDIIDKIAVALACYLRLKGAQKKSFANLWGKKSKGGVFQFAKEIEAALMEGNQGLVALYNLSQDLSKDDSSGIRGDGFMVAHKRYRNASTHRFTVLHDMGGHDCSPPSLAVEHQQIEDFERLTLSTLKLARAALFYFVDAIVFSEKCKHRDGAGLVHSLKVPDHDYIRGRA